MAGGSEMPADDRLHPGKPVPKPVVWVDLMHEGDRLLFQDLCPVVDAVVHMHDQEMGQVHDRGIQPACGVKPCSPVFLWWDDVPKQEGQLVDLVVSPGEPLVRDCDILEGESGEVKTGMGHVEGGEEMNVAVLKEGFPRDEFDEVRDEVEADVGVHRVFPWAVDSAPEAWVIILTTGEKEFGEVRIREE